MIDLTLYHGREIRVTYQAMEERWVWRARHPRPPRPRIGIRQGNQPEGLPVEEAIDLLKSPDWATKPQIIDVLDAQIAAQIGGERGRSDIRALSRRLADELALRFESYEPEPEPLRYQAEFYLSKWGPVVCLREAALDLTKLAADLAPLIALIPEGPGISLNPDGLAKAISTAIDTIKASKSWIIPIRDPDHRTVGEAIQELIELKDYEVWESVSEFDGANAPIVVKLDAITTHFGGRMEPKRVEAVVMELERRGALMLLEGKLGDGETVDVDVGPEGLVIQGTPIAVAA